MSQANPPEVSLNPPPSTLPPNQQFPTFVPRPINPSSVCPSFPNSPILGRTPPQPYLPGQIVNQINLGETRSPVCPFQNFFFHENFQPVPSFYRLFLTSTKLKRKESSPISKNKPNKMPRCENSLSQLTTRFVELVCGSEGTLGE